MKNVLIFNLNADRIFFENIVHQTHFEKGELKTHRFPDGEMAVRILTDVKNKSCIVTASLKNPDLHLTALYFLCNALKENGATEIIILAPYLPYMRQDKAFNEGDVITSKYFAQFISAIADKLITIDPHLHRWHSLNDIYSIPAFALSASSTISQWIKDNVKNPILIGPDSESRQWVSNVAAAINCPYAVLEKTRHGDKDVEIHFSDFDACSNCTPVLIDDIISTAQTMIKTTEQLLKSGFTNPVCIGVHALFNNHAYELLLQAGASEIVTCNTVFHLSNRIDISPLIFQKLNEIVVQ